VADKGRQRAAGPFVIGHLSFRGVIASEAKQSPSDCAPPERLAENELGDFSEL
jgi:hypothetical protein